MTWRHPTPPASQASASCCACGIEKYLSSFLKGGDICFECRRRGVTPASHRLAKLLRRPWRIKRGR